MVDAQNPHLPQKSPDQLAEAYGIALGDQIPDDTHFVLLVFNGKPIGQGGGIGWSSSADAYHAVEVVRTFLASVDASIKQQQQAAALAAQKKNGGG